MNMKDVMTGKMKPGMDDGDGADMEDAADTDDDVKAEIGDRIARALGVAPGKVDATALAEAIGDLIDSR